MHFCQILINIPSVTNLYNRGKGTTRSQKRSALGHQGIWREEGCDEYGSLQEEMMRGTSMLWARPPTPSPWQMTKEMSQNMTVPPAPSCRPRTSAVETPIILNLTRTWMACPVQNPIRICAGGGSGVSIHRHSADLRWRTSYSQCRQGMNWDVLVTDRYRGLADEIES